MQKEEMGVVNIGDRFQFIPSHLDGQHLLRMPGGVVAGVIRTGTVIHVSREHHHFTVEYETASGKRLREGFKIYGDRRK